jgi:cobyric acid synthase
MKLLKTDLVDSGNDKRVVYAMIKNFQNRIELLEQVIEKIEEVKNLNTNKNENTI